MRQSFKIGDASHELELARAATAYRLHFGGEALAVNLQADADGRTWLTLGGRRIEVVVATRGDDVFVHIDGEAHHLRYQHPLDRYAEAASGGVHDTVRAPMPGCIVAVHVKAGDFIARDQTLLVMESMKMETSIAAPRDGVVQAVHFEKGQVFDLDALLLSLQPLESAP